MIRTVRFYLALFCATVMTGTTVLVASLLHLSLIHI